MSPWALKIALEAGEIVKTSLPLGVPDRERPRLRVVPLIFMLDGVAEESVATPPDIDRVKSATSRVEVELEDPPYASSENVIDTVELLEVIVVEVIFGGSLMSLTLIVSALAKVLDPSLA